MCSLRSHAGLGEIEGTSGTSRTYKEGYASIGFNAGHAKAGSDGKNATEENENAETGEKEDEKGKVDIRRRAEKARFQCKFN
jgi:hypothetical protein